MEKTKKGEKEVKLQMNKYVKIWIVFAIILVVAVFCGLSCVLPVLATVQLHCLILVLFLLTA